MVLMKEIKRKDYLKGTKALRVRHYIFAGMVAFTVAFCVPLYYKAMKDMPALQEKKKEEERMEDEKAKQVFELKAILLDRSGLSEPPRKN